MKSDGGRSGSVFIVILLVIAVVAGFYFMSAPFKTRFDETKRQATTWTPENIQKNPVGYLQYAVSEIDGVSSKLEARALSLSTQKNQSQRQADKAATEAGQLERMLAQAKALYVQTAESGAWPVEMNGHMVSEEQLKERIVSAHQKAEALVLRAGACKQNSAKLELALKDLFQKQKDTAGLQRKLQSDLEMVKINQSVKDIDDIEDSVSAIMATSQALAGMDEKDLPELDALLDVPESAKIDAAFQTIMQQ